ncbi:MAG: hypothetical protein QOC66_1976, partial [Pseudonocardiales bacterium]|nr:hypothetical protein [Pseudonocardiales bacterium]
MSEVGLVVEDVGWVPPDGPLFCDDSDVAPEDAGPGCSADEVAAWAAAAPLGSGLLTPWGVLDPAALTDGGRIDALLACARLHAWVDAQEQRLLAALAPSADRADKGFVRDEIACALRLAPAVVSAKLGTATELVHRLPGTLELLETGQLSYAHARLLTDAVQPLDDPLAATVEARVLDR